MLPAVHALKAVSAVDGVDMVAVNLLTNSMVVDGKADASVVIGAVENAGYGAEEKSNDTKKEKDDVLKDEQTPLMLKAYFISCVADSADVCFYGPYDVGLARAVFS